MKQSSQIQLDSINITDEAITDYIAKDYKETDSVIDFVGKDTNDSEETEDKLLRIYKEKTCLVIEKLSGIGLPKKNEQLRLITKRSFNAIALLEWVISLEGNIDEALFCIFSINYEASVIIDTFIKSGKIKTATILMSNLRNIAYRKKEEATKNMFVNNPKVELIFASSHAKILSFKSGDNYYTVEGSGNLSYNNQIEQYVIDNDKVLFDFTKEWIEEIKKHLKGKKSLTVYPKT